MPKATPLAASMYPLCLVTSSQLTVGSSTAGKTAPRQDLNQVPLVSQSWSLTNPLCLPVPKVLTLLRPFWPLLEKPVSFTLYWVLVNIALFEHSFRELDVDGPWHAAFSGGGGHQVGEACTRCTECCKKLVF